MKDQKTLLLVQEFCAAFKPGDGTGVLTARAEDVDWLIPGGSPLTVGLGFLYGLGLRLSNKASLGLYFDR